MSQNVTYRGKDCQEEIEEGACYGEGVTGGSLLGAYYFLIKTLLEVFMETTLCSTVPRNQSLLPHLHFRITLDRKPVLALPKCDTSLTFP
jgi:hypothetical protein